MGLTLALVAAAYSNSFKVPFLFDDIPSIVENPTVLPEPQWHQAAGWDLPGGLTVSGRPLLNATFLVSAAVSGDSPWGFHVINLLIHCATGALIWWWLRQLLATSAVTGEHLAARAGLIAGIAAAWWLLHPLQTESVTYIVQRAESLVSFWVILTLAAFTRGVRSSDPRRARFWLGLALFANVCGMATKEVMAVTPLLVWACDRVFVTGAWRAALRRRPAFYAGLAAGWLVLLTLMLTTAGRGDTAGLGSDLTPWRYASIQLAAIPHYLRLALWPAPLIFDYGRGVISPPMPFALAIPLFVALVGATLAVARRRPVLAFAGFWWLLLLAPSSSVVPIATQTIAEHRAYLALLAPATIGAVLLVRFAGQRALPVAIGVAAVLAGLTHHRNTTYADATTLWSDTVAHRPANPRAHHNLALAHFNSGDLTTALAHYRVALNLAPTDPETHYNVGLTLARLQRWPEAIAAYRTSLDLAPDQTAAMNNLGLALQHTGRLDEAAAWLQRAVAREPDSPELLTNLSAIELDRANVPAALQHAEQAARLAPDRPATLLQLGTAQAAARRLPAARQTLERAAALAPADARVAFNLGNVCLEQDDVAAAIRHYQTAARLDPAFPAPARNLGYILARLGRTAEARAYLQAYRQLVPADSDAQALLRQLSAGAAP